MPLGSQFIATPARRRRHSRSGYDILTRQREDAEASSSSDSESSVYSDSDSSSVFSDVSERRAAPLESESESDDSAAAAAASLALDERKAFFGSIQARLLGRKETPLLPAVREAEEDAGGVANKTQLDLLGSLLSGPAAGTGGEKGGAVEPAAGSPASPPAPPRPLPTGPFKSVALSTWPWVHDDTEQHVSAELNSRYDLLQGGQAHSLTNWPFTLEGAPAAEGTTDPQTGQIVRVGDQPEIPYSPAWIRARMERILRMHADPIYRFVGMVAAKVQRSHTFFFAAPQIFGASTGRNSSTIPRGFAPPGSAPAAELERQRQRRRRSRRQLQGQLEDSYRKNSDKLEQLMRELMGAENELAEHTRGPFEQAGNEPAQEGEDAKLARLQVRVRELRVAVRAVIRDMSSAMSGNNTALRVDLGKIVPEIADLEIKISEKRAEINRLAGEYTEEVSKGGNTVEARAIEEQTAAAEEELAKLEGKLRGLIAAAVLLAERESEVGRLLDRANPGDDLANAWTAFLDRLAANGTEQAARLNRALRTAIEEEREFSRDGSRAAASAASQSAVSVDRVTLRRIWMSMPENLGVIIWTPEFDAGVQSAVSKLRSVANCDFLLYDLVDSEAVRSNFADLVAVYIQRATLEAGSRYGSHKLLARFDARELRLLKWFAEVRCDAQGVFTIPGARLNPGPASRARLAALESGVAPAPPANALFPPATSPPPARRQRLRRVPGSYRVVRI